VGALIDTPLGLSTEGEQDDKKIKENMIAGKMKYLLTYCPPDFAA
jgi:hypothetical protein